MGKKLITEILRITVQLIVYPVTVHSSTTKYTGAVFVNLPKAFDTVNHFILCVPNWDLWESSFDLLYSYLPDH